MKRSGFKQKHWRLNTWSDWEVKTVFDGTKEKVRSRLIEKDGELWEEIEVVPHYEA